MFASLLQIRGLNLETETIFSIRSEDLLRHDSWAVAHCLGLGAKIPTTRIARQKYGLTKLEVDQTNRVAMILASIFSLEAGAVVTKIGFACRVVASPKGWPKLSLRSNIRRAVLDLPLFISSRSPIPIRARICEFSCESLQLLYAYLHNSILSSYIIPLVAFRVRSAPRLFLDEKFFNPQIFGSLSMLISCTCTVLLRSS